MDVPFYISKRVDPLRDRSIFKRRNSEAPNAVAHGFITPQPTIARPSEALDARGPLSPWTAPAAGHASQQPAWSPHHSLTNSASEFNRSDIARQIRANFDSLVRASPLPRAVESLVVPTGGTPVAHRQHWRAQPPTFAEAATTPLVGSGTAIAQWGAESGQHAAWRPVPSPHPNFTVAWPQANAGVAVTSQPSQLQRPQPVRASPGPASAGLLQSVLAASPAPSRASQMHSPLITTAHLGSGKALGSAAAQASPGTPSAPQGGPAASGFRVPPSRDPRLAARNAAASPATPHAQTLSPVSQQDARMPHRDPRLKGSAQSSGEQTPAARREPEASPLAEFLPVAAAVQSQAEQQPDAEQPDSEVGQAVWALEGAHLAGDEERGRLQEALLETGPACQPQDCDAAPGTLGPFPDLLEPAHASGTGPEEGTSAPEDAMACPGWQVEAFLNDMGSDEEPGRQTAAGSGPRRTQELPCKEMQQDQDGQEASAWLKGQGVGLAEAVECVEQLCADLDLERGLERTSAPTHDPDSLPAAEPANDTHNDAHNEDLSRDVPCPMPLENAALLQLSSTSALRPPLEERQDGNASQQEPSTAGKQQPPKKAPAAVHSPSASHRTEFPVGLAGSSLPATRPATPKAPFHAAVSTQERSSASGQCRTLTSHTQRPRQAPPQHASQEAANSPGRQPQHAARPAHTPSRFKGEAHSGGVASRPADSAGAALDRCDEALSLPHDTEVEATEDAAGTAAEQEQASGSGAPAADAGEWGGVEPSAGEQQSDLGAADGLGRQKKGRRSGAGASEQQAVGSTHSDGSWGVEQKSQGKKRKQASAPVEPAKKRPASSQADLTAKQEQQLQAIKAEVAPDVNLQVSRTGRVRVKPLAFWANQRLSRDALAIDQGFSDQLAQQCQSFVQQPKPRSSPTNGSAAAAKAPSSGHSNPPSSPTPKSAAPQKGRKMVEGVSKGLKRPAVQPPEAARPPIKKPKPVNSGTTGKKPTGEKDGGAEEPQAVEYSSKDKLAVTGQRVRAVRNTTCVVCKRAKRGYCGTERAVRGCLKRGQGQNQSPAEPVAAAAVSNEPTEAVEDPPAASGPSKGRTLGIQAQLEALSQRQHASPAADKGVGKAKAQQKGKPGSKPSGTRGGQSKQQSSGSRAATEEGTAAGTAADSGGGRDGGAAAAEKQRPGLRRLRKATAAESPREDAAELAAAARDLEDYEDDAQELSAAQLLAQRFSPGKGEGKKAKATKAKRGDADGSSGACGLDTPDRQGDTSAAATEVATPVRGPQGDDEEEDADGWTQTQRDALQRAHAEEDPTGNAFWQRVAQQVPGKDAQQCFSKFWAGNPTPAPSRAAGPRAYLDAAAASSPLAPPARTTAAGNARKLPAAATRKWARQVRWQERASQDGAASEAAADGNAADGKSRPALNPHLVAAMQRAQRTDKYIDAIIRKRGNPQRWQSGSMANGSGRSQAESAPAEVSRRPALVDSTVAAIASSAQTMPESDDESEQDEYWSGDESDG